MKPLTPRLHGLLDYVTVVAFALAPSVLGLAGLPRTISYLLAVVHLLLTLVTRFPLGVLRLVPLKLHGGIELVVSIVLILLPWILGFSASPVAKWFYVGAGVVILCVWFLSRYDAPAHA